MATVTEAQKKQIMILLAAFLTIIIYISGIRPLQDSIRGNQARLDTVKLEQEEMQAVIDNPNIEAEYVKLREEYEVKFQQRFENYKSNEKIEAITRSMNMPIKTINIRDFEPVNTSVYERYIAQPRTAEELETVRQDENTPVFALLLASKVDLVLNINSLKDELMMYDAFNNIPPVGPGESDPDRYTQLVTSMSLKHLGTAENGEQSISYSILVFAMETMDLSEWDKEFEERKTGQKE